MKKPERRLQRKACQPPSLPRGRRCRWIDIQRFRLRPWRSRLPPVGGERGLGWVVCVRSRRPSRTLTRPSARRMLRRMAYWPSVPMLRRQCRHQREKLTVSVANVRRLPCAYPNRQVLRRSSKSEPHFRGEEERWIVATTRLGDNGPWSFRQQSSRPMFGTMLWANSNLGFPLCRVSAPRPPM